MKKYKEVKTKEDNNKRVKRSIVLMSILILIGITIFIGTSYALFSIMIKGEKKVSIQTGTFKVDMEDGKYIKVEALGTMSDKEGKETKPYKFTVKNTGTIGAYYSLYLTEESGELNTYYLKYELTGTDGNIKEGRIGTLSRFNINQYLEAGGSVTYELRLWLDKDTPNSEQGKSYQSKIALEGSQEKIITGVERLLKDYTNSEDAEFNEDTKNKMFIYHHEETEQQKGWSKEELTDYRYIGANPNNYVTFNNELWKIIGIFTVENEKGEKEQRIKLIHNQGIGQKAWDTGNVSNWTKASLMKEINPYTGSTTYQWNNVSLKMIEDTKWYLGGTKDYTGSTNGTVGHFYEYERGKITYQNNKPTSWIGKVGLIYPSDYGYATSGGESITKKQCLTTAMYSWNSAEDCYNNDWIYKSINPISGTYNQWTLSPYTNNSYFVFYVYYSGYGYTNANSTYGIARPSVYLVSSVQISQGKGTEQDPFVFTK